MNRYINQTIAVFLTAGIVTVIPVSGYAGKPSSSAIRVGDVVIPQAFGNALRDGMSIPLFIHLNDNKDKNSDIRIGTAFLWLDGDKLTIRNIEPDNDNSLLNTDTHKQLTALSEQPFNDELRIPVSSDSELYLDLKQLNLQLVISKSALGTVMQSKSSDIGESGVSQLSSTLNYNLGVYNNRARNSSSNTSGYLSLENITALLEHHIILNGALYGLGSGHNTSTLYKALYERDYNGHRFAAGLLDSWSLQSLGPVTAIPSGKVIGFSWGNRADSTIFDNNQSVTPVVVFLPAAGEVYLYREGRLLSIQNFDMGNHEVDTRSLPYGSYDIDAEVMVNSKIIEKRSYRINKLFTRNGNNAPFSWQFWGGSLKMDRWYPGGKQTSDKITAEHTVVEREKITSLAGISGSGSFGVFSWSATAYGYDKNAILETQASVPVSDKININIQNMVANDGSHSNIANISATLPGDFSSVWITREKTNIGDRIRRSDVDSLSVGGTINLGAAWSPLGTLTASYTDDKTHENRYYTVDYNQNLYSGSWGNLSMRVGMQAYNNTNNNNTGKYVSLDFSLPLGNWFSAGMTHQRGYTMANVSARKHFDDGAVRTLGVNASRAVSGNTGDDKTLSGGAYAQFDTRYSKGTVNISSGADGYVNTSLTASGSAGWNGKYIGASGMTDGNAGLIFNTAIDNDGLLSADVNGRRVELKNGYNYLPVSSYAQYDIEIMNSKKSTASYNIAGGRKTKVTLYPGNVAVIEPEIKQMVTVFGRFRAEDGTLLTNAHINNHIGRTRTNEAGEFVMDIDKKFPVIDFSYGNNQNCEVELNLTGSNGAIWVGDVVCTGLKTYAQTQSSGKNYEG